MKIRQDIVNYCIQKNDLLYPAHSGLVFAAPCVQTPAISSQQIDIIKMQTSITDQLCAHISTKKQFSLALYLYFGNTVSILYSRQRRTRFLPLPPSLLGCHAPSLSSLMSSSTASPSDPYLSVRCSGRRSFMSKFGPTRESSE